MANLNITINLDNAAYDDNPDEVADVLAQVMRQFDNAQASGDWVTLFDSNGNDTGRFRVGEPVHAQRTGRDA